MRNVSSLFSEKYLHQTYSYAEYLALMNQVVAEQRTTGPKQTPELAEYTRLNQYRMNRLNKTVVLSQELQQLIYQIEAPQTWYLLTEAWCGDAAQSAPVIAKVAAMNPHLTLRLLLRDEHPEIMDAYLTHGGRSIPKLIALDTDGNELFSWGPRPVALQEIMLEYKKNPTVPYKEFAEEVQRWYNADKTQTIQYELAELLKVIFVKSDVK